MLISLGGNLRCMSCRVSVVCVSNGSDKVSPIDRAGFSEPYGSWNTTWMSRPSVRRRRSWETAAAIVQLPD